jgi:NADPH:quinone reductase-like Zn-dependent oxidoreductase
MLQHALCYHHYGPPSSALTLRIFPLPLLAAGKVRVKMRYAAVNPSDLIPVTGAYRHRTRLPATAGYEGVGVVVDAPPGASVAPGQRVLPLRGAAPGRAIWISTHAGWYRSLMRLTIGWPPALILTL